LAVEVLVEVGDAEGYQSLGSRAESVEVRTVCLSAPATSLWEQIEWNNPLQKLNYTVVVELVEP
jgi:hypothetical protein